MSICEDDVDLAILRRLIEAGEEGILPKDLAKDLSGYKLKPEVLTHRIRRMNKMLEKKVGKRAAKKLGEKWVVTTFMRNILGIQTTRT